MLRVSVLTTSGRLPGPVQDLGRLEAATVALSGNARLWMAGPRREPLRAEPVDGDLGESEASDTNWVLPAPPRLGGARALTHATTGSMRERSAKVPPGIVCRYPSPEVIVDGCRVRLVGLGARRGPATKIANAIARRRAIRGDLDVVAGQRGIGARRTVDETRVRTCGVTSRCGTRARNRWSHCNKSASPRVRRGARGMADRRGDPSGQ